MKPVKIKQIFQNKLILRYLFSYIALFFLPLIVMNFLSYHHTQDMMKAELIHNQEMLLEKLQISTESELSKFRLIVNQLTLKGYDVSIPPTNPTKGLSLIQFLSVQKNVNPFLNDIVIYYKNDNRYFSSTSSYQPEYFEKIYKNQPDSIKSLATLIDSPDKLYTAPASVILSSSGEEKNIVMIYPVSRNGVSIPSLLLFFFSEQKLCNLCYQYYDPSCTTIFMLNGNNEILSVFGNNQDIILENYTTDEDNTLFNDLSQPSFCKIDGEPYLITSTYSSEVEWHFIAYTKVNSALSTSILLRNQQLLFNIVLILIGGFFIVLCMYYNFLPLYNLIDLANSLSLPTKSQTHNELDTIAETLNQLFSENMSLNTRLENTYTASKEYIISQLLTGHALKREYLELSSVTTILSSHYDRYAVFLLHFDNLLLENSKTLLIEEIEAFSDKDIVFLCKEDLKQNTFVSIVLINNTAELHFPKVLDQMKQNLKLSSTNCFSMGISNIYPLLENLPQAYIEACTALDYHFIKGSNTVIAFSNIKSIALDTSAYPYEQIHQFQAALSMGNTDKLEQALDAISSCLSRDDMTIFRSKSICQDIIALTLKAIPEMQTLPKNESVSIPDTFLLSQCDTVNDLINMVKQLGYDICKYINLNYDANNQIMIKNIHDFLLEKSYDCNFSLDTVAEHFHMTASSLATFYKEHTGETLFETITRLRMEKAIVLLENTSLPINQICINVGYDNVSSFIRRFKQIYHTTPGIWRENRH